MDLLTGMFRDHHQDGADVHHSSRFRGFDRRRQPSIVKYPRRARFQSRQQTEVPGFTGLVELCAREPAVGSPGSIDFTSIIRKKTESGMSGDMPSSRKRAVSVNVRV